MTCILPFALCVRSNVVYGRSGVLCQWGDKSVRLRGEIGSGHFVRCVVLIVRCGYGTGLTSVGFVFAG